MYNTVFLDANVLADLYDTSRPFSQASREAVEALLLNETTRLFTSCDVMATIYYIFSKRNKEQALNHIIEINRWCDVVEFGNAEIAQSTRLMKENPDFTDLEDTIQYVMARKVNADLILSNDRGFVSEEIDVMGTEALCSQWVEPKG